MMVNSIKYQSKISSFKIVIHIEILLHSSLNKILCLHVMNVNFLEALIRIIENCVKKEFQIDKNITIIPLGKLILLTLIPIH